MSNKIRLTTSPVVFLLLVGMKLALSGSEPEKTAPRKNPRLTSLFPLGGQQGSQFDITVHGEDLQRVRKVWFDCEHLIAEVNDVIGVTIEKTRFSTKLPTPAQNVSIRVNVSPETPSGIYALRLLTEDGMSDVLPLLITSEPIAFEQVESHNTAVTAQAVDLPTNLSGKLGKNAELDFYSFEVQKNQELQFEVLVTGGILPGSAVQFPDPELILYDPSGSWFDSNKAVRIEALDESTILPAAGNTKKPRLRHRFNRAGRHLVLVTSRGNKGGPGHGYHLRIKAVNPNRKEPSWTDLPLAPPPSFELWQERGFTRKLSLARYQQLWPRTVAGVNPRDRTGHNPITPHQLNRLTGSETALEVGGTVLEKEPNAEVHQTLDVSRPVLIQGNIECPGDIDHFSFDVTAGDALAFEVETTNQIHPDFTPWMVVSNSHDQNDSSNIHRMVEGNSGVWLKDIKSKMILTFEKSGEYTLRVSDLTSRRGGSDFNYHLLIRPQVPHIGEVTLRGKDCLNLVPGETKALTLIVDREEGFSDPVVLFLENLPPGIQTEAVTVKAETTPPVKNFRGEINRDWFFPIKQKVVLTLVVDDDAQVTNEPCRARLMAQAGSEQRSGKPFPLQNLYMMVVSAN
jgi:hypothetical protein